MCVGKSYINVSGSLDALSQGTWGNLEGVQVEVTPLRHEGRNNTHHNNNGIVYETKGKRQKHSREAATAAPQSFCREQLSARVSSQILTRQMPKKKKRKPDKKHLNHFQHFTPKEGRGMAALTGYEEPPICCTTGTGLQWAVLRGMTTGKQRASTCTCTPATRVSYNRASGRNGLGSVAEHPL